jgi:hypothetical protein
MWKCKAYNPVVPAANPIIYCNELGSSFSLTATTQHFVPATSTVLTTVVYYTAIV